MYLNPFLSLVSDRATVVLWWSSCRALLYYDTYRKKTLLLLSPLFQRVSTRERERESLQTFNSATPGHFARSINLLLTSFFSLWLAATLSQLLVSS
jgi:hypothetical protein